MAAAAPSTVAPNPLEESMRRALGERPDISGSTLGYDPAQSFRPQGDILNIIPGAPSSGMTGYESEQVRLEEERQRAADLEREWKERSAAEESARSASQLAIQQAQESREAALGPSKMTAAELANLSTQAQTEATRAGMTAQAAQTALEAQKFGLSKTEAAQVARQREQEIALKAAAEKRAADLHLVATGGIDPAQAYAAARGRAALTFGAPTGSPLYGRMQTMAQGVPPSTIQAVAPTRYLPTGGASWAAPGGRTTVSAPIQQAGQPWGRTQQYAYYTPTGGGLSMPVHVQQPWYGPGGVNTPKPVSYY